LESSSPRHARESNDAARPAAVSTASARRAPASAVDLGDAAQERLCTTDVQHDEHQRAPTSAYDRLDRRARSAS
jgi:hypothetical protein